MRMDEPFASERNQHVRLAAPDARKYDVARPVRGRAGPQPAAREDRIETCGREGAHRVSNGQRSFPADCCECGRKHPDAIDAGRGLAPLQPKTRPDKRQRCIGQGLTTHYAGAG